MLTEFPLHDDGAWQKGNARPCSKQGHRISPITDAKVIKPAIAGKGNDGFFFSFCLHLTRFGSSEMLINKSSLGILNLLVVSEDAEQLAQVGDDVGGN